MFCGRLDQSVSFYNELINTKNCITLLPFIFPFSWEGVLVGKWLRKKELCVSIGDKTAS